jgi:hypothetical protein
VDCALIYNPRLFQVRDVKLVPYVYILEKDSARNTRGFLTVSGTLAGEHVVVIVNHLPSRAAESFYREEGGRQLRIVKDSLVKADPQAKKNREEEEGEIPSPFPVGEECHQAHHA